MSFQTSKCDCILHSLQLMGKTATINHDIDANWHVSGTEKEQDDGLKSLNCL